MERYPRSRAKAGGKAASALKYKAPSTAAYDLSRELLFRLDAERAHEWSLALLQRFPRLAALAFRQPVADDPVQLLGLKFPNRVGLAAGLDKNGLCLNAWGQLGFGFIEVGTVTPRPQPGNPRPRMFRLPAQQAIINRLGFNNLGVDFLIERIRRSRYAGILGVNIGKNADTPLERAAEDYLACLGKVYTEADYVTVNISSPNTKNLRDLQDEARLQDLLQQVAASRRELAQRHGASVPILVKIAPDVSEEQLPGIARIARETGMDGLIATNTTITRPALDQDPLAQQAGGLSGAPLQPLSTGVLRRLRGLVGADYPLIGVGGICSGSDALAKRKAGADLVQIYTGFIYRGPVLIAEASRALALP